MYEQQYDGNGKFLGAKRLTDGAFVPKAPGNRNWQEFLEWNKQQNPPLPTEDVAPPVRRTRKVLTAIAQDINALSAADQRKLLLAVQAKVLYDDPQFARRLGIALDGDE